VDLYDCHVHSAYSPDSRVSPDDLCRAAISRGLKGVCFTDHVEFAPGDVVPSPGEIEEWFARIDELRTSYREALEIAVGVEVGYYPGFAQDITALLTEFPFEFVLGSVHVVDGVNYCYDACEDENGVEYYGAYLNILEEMLSSIDIDVVGHFDLPKRFGPWLTSSAGRRVGGLSPGSELWPRVGGILQRVVDQGSLLEVNSSGFRQPPGEAYPSVNILAEYRQRGGCCVTLGSDGHTRGNIGRNLRRAATFALRAGLTEGAWFRNREQENYSLSS